MLIVEERFLELGATLPAIVGAENEEFTPSFGFGTQTDLLRFLSEKRALKVKHYPIGWLVKPFTCTGPNNRIRFPFRMIFAELSNGSMSNEERLEVTIKPMLVPFYENFRKALDQSGFTKIVNPDDVKLTVEYNFGVSKSQEVEHYTTDIWDTIIFECNLEMDNCPLREITF